jgi:hypothetical protein
LDEVLTASSRIWNSCEPKYLSRIAKRANKRAGWCRH